MIETENRLHSPEIIGVIDFWVEWQAQIIPGRKIFVGMRRSHSEDRELQSWGPEKTREKNNLCSA